MVLGFGGMVLMASAEACAAAFQAVLVALSLAIVVVASRSYDEDGVLAMAGTPRHEEDGKEYGQLHDPPPSLSVKSLPSGVPPPWINRPTKAATQAPPMSSPVLPGAATCDAIEHTMKMAMAAKQLPLRLLSFMGK